MLLARNTLRTGSSTPLFSEGGESWSWVDESIYNTCTCKIWQIYIGVVYSECLYTNYIMYSYKKLCLNMRASPIWMMKNIRDTPRAIVTPLLPGNLKEVLPFLMKLCVTS